VPSDVPPDAPPDVLPSAGLSQAKQAELLAMSAPYLKDGDGATAGAVASVACFQTSIWDATLCGAPQRSASAAVTLWARGRYAAWSSIVHALIPNVEVLARHLEKLRRINEADEARPPRPDAAQPEPAPASCS
jgi:hypothetical protein